MQYAVFNVPVKQAAEACEELNAFLRGHKVLGVRKELVSQGDDIFWTCAVEYLGRSSMTAQPLSERKRVDYKEELTSEQFALFSRLREKRKELAEQDGVPVYAVLTNEQLAEIVRRKAFSTAELGAIEGVGEAKLAKYGAGILAALGPVGS